jgi:hypothetical protein
MAGSDEEKAKAGSRLDPELEANLRDELAEEAMLEFRLDGRPAALAKYLHVGGAVTDEVREVLIELLRDHPAGLPGGRRPARDWTTYMEVEFIRKQASIDQALAQLADEDKGSSSVPARKLSLRKAQEEYARRTNRELRTVQLQYERGMKIDQGGS